MLPLLMHRLVSITREMTMTMLQNALISKQGFIILSVAAEILDKQLSNERPLCSASIISVIAIIIVIVIISTKLFTI